MLALSGCAEQVRKELPPRLGRGFPSAESFYPLDARVAKQQGVSTVHFCVGADGKLSDIPSIAVSSGVVSLDSAAIELAKAGSGHYIPGSKNGANVHSCGAFEVRFKLVGELSLPALSAKLRHINSQFKPRIVALMQNLHPPPDLSKIVPGDAEQLRKVREAAANLAAVLDQLEALMSDYMASIERLSRADDVPEAERSAFRTYWPALRDSIEGVMAQGIAATRSAVNAMNDLGDYVEAAQPPFSGPAGVVTPTAEQRAEIELSACPRRTERRWCANLTEKGRPARLDSVEPRPCCEYRRGRDLYLAPSTRSAEYSRRVKRRPARVRVASCLAASQGQLDTASRQARLLRRGYGAINKVENS